LAAEPGLLAEFAAERELPRIPRRLGSVPIFDEHTGLPVTTVAALVTEFINPDPSAARILPRLGTAVVDRPGHITLKVLSAPAPYPLTPPTPDPAGAAPDQARPAREPQQEQVRRHDIQTGANADAPRPPSRSRSPSLQAAPRTTRTKNPLSPRARWRTTTAARVPA
jgi:hypothetical protein